MRSGLRSSVFVEWVEILTLVDGVDGEIGAGRIKGGNVFEEKFGYFSATIWMWNHLTNDINYGKRGTGRR